MTDHPVQIHRIPVSPGHNFFGHYGGPAGTHPIVEQPECRCVAGRGIKDDSLFDHKNNDKEQITFFAWDVFQALKQATGTAACPPSALRRNVLIEGINLNLLVGHDFELGGIRFHGVEECRPCAWMDEVVGPGAEAFLKGQGGLRARILTDGHLQAGSTTLRILDTRS